MDRSKFKHKIIETVKFHEVDILGVCNNAVYFNYLEDARIKYLQDLGNAYSFKEFLVGDSFVIIVHNEIDYFHSAEFDDVLGVFTKIAKVSKSSFSFDHEIYREEDNIIIAKGSGILVHINKHTKKSMELPDEFNVAVLDYEGV